MSFSVKVKRLHPEAKLPAFAHPGDAGMDVFALHDITIKKGEYAKIPTGIAMEIPHGFAALVWDKSGLATNHGLKTIGGVIDAGYRGEYMIGMINLGANDHTFKKHEKVAQILVQRVEQPSIEESETLSDSSRGAGGFGSTGK